ncbi:hypothetical protein D3C81_1388100 [compost metagenome]
MGQHHAQHQQQVTHCRPLSKFVATQIGILRLLNIGECLPDPHRDARRATEEIRRDVEHCPPAFAQQCPPSLGVGLRLPISEFGQGFGIALEQHGKHIARQFIRREPDRAGPCD